MLQRHTMESNQQEGEKFEVGQIVLANEPIDDEWYWPAIVKSVDAVGGRSKSKSRRSDGKKIRVQFLGFSDCFSNLDVECIQKYDLEKVWSLQQRYDSCKYNEAVSAAEFHRRKNEPKIDFGAKPSRLQQPGVYVNWNLKKVKMESDFVVKKEPEDNEEAREVNEETTARENPKDNEDTSDNNNNNDAQDQYQEKQVEMMDVETKLQSALNSKSKIELNCNEIHQLLNIIKSSREESEGSKTQQQEKEEVEMESDASDTDEMEEIVEETEQETREPAKKRKIEEIENSRNQMAKLQRSQDPPEKVNMEIDDVPVSAQVEAEPKETESNNNDDGEPEVEIFRKSNPMAKPKEVQREAEKEDTKGKERVNFKCAEPNCGADFVSSTGLKRHQANHKKLKKFLCSSCPYKTHRKFDLTRHVKNIHSELKPFKCPHENCEHSAKQKSDLNEHLKIHSLEKNQVCPHPNCGFKTKWLSHLKLHMEIHSNGEKRHKCHFCEYSSHRSDHLVRHVRSHTLETPFACQLCSYKTKQKTHLTRHMKTHADSKTQQF